MPLVMVLSHSLRCAYHDYLLDDLTAVSGTHSLRADDESWARDFPDACSGGQGKATRQACPR